MNPEQEWTETAKRKAAKEAVKHVKDSSIVGLGSGSTAAYAIEALGKRIKEEKINILAIPSSSQAFLCAVKNGIAVTTLEEHEIIDVTIDGADQIDPKLNLIKGMGGALTREKIVAAASKLNIIIADESKKVKILGEKKHPLPIEVLSFAAPLAKRKIIDMGGLCAVREGKGKVGPIVTDNGNLIIDATFGAIKKPAELDKKLKAIPGVIETGLFLGLTDIAYIGTQLSTEKIKSQRR